MYSFIKEINFFKIDFKFIFIILVLTLFASVAEIISLSIFIPVFESLQNLDQGSNKKGLITDYIEYFFNFFSIKFSLLNLILISFFLFSLGRLIIFFSILINSFYETSFLKKTRDRMIKQYFAAESDYHDTLKTSDFINVCQVQLKQAIGKTFLSIKFISNLFTALISIIALFLISVKLSLISILGIVIPIIISSIWIRQSRHIGRKHSESERKLTNYLFGRLKAAKFVFLSGSAKKEIAIYSNIANDARKFLFKNTELKLKTQTFLEVSSIFIALILSFVAINYFYIEFDIVILYLLISIRLIPIIKNLSVNFQTIKSYIGPMEIVKDFFITIENYSTTIKSKNSKNYNTLKINQFELVNVNYKYSKASTLAIKNINLNIYSSSLNLLVGPSGSGKSTILDILSTFRKPQSGKYLINGEIYNEDMRERIISQISYLPQETVFFEENAFDHITYNSNNFDTNLFDEAITLSGVSEFFDLKSNFKKIKLNENASNLSGGQKQRIDLARIIYEKKSILILDEPTNKLDYHQEKLFFNNIRELVNKKKIMVIIISHKIELGSKSDNIFILNNGSIIDNGKHTELINRNDWYKNNFIDKIN